MNADDSANSGERRAIAALFPDRSSAHAAISNLKDAHVHNVWMGIAKRHDNGYADDGGAHDVSSGGGFGGAIGRFFRGEDLGYTLQQALVDHGLSRSEAQQIDDQIPNDGAVVVFDPGSRYAEAQECVTEAGGTLFGGDAYASALQGGYAAGRVRTTDLYENRPYDEQYDRASTDVGETTRAVPLRHEEVDILKRDVVAGEASIRREVRSEDRSIDVPLYHEEIFIERRPVSGASSNEPIGSDEMRIPLHREELDVNKRVVADEEVVISKRAVAETQRVDETVRREEIVGPEGTADGSDVRTRAKSRAAIRGSNVRI